MSVLTGIIYQSKTGGGGEGGCGECFLVSDVKKNQASTSSKIIPLVSTVMSNRLQSFVHMEPSPKFPNRGHNMSLFFPTGTGLGFFSCIVPRGLQPGWWVADNDSPNFCQVPRTTRCGI